MGLYSSLGLDVVMVGCKLIEMLLFLTFEHGYSYGSNDNFPFYFSSLHVFDSDSIISLSLLLITTSASTAFVWQSVASAEIQLSFLCAYLSLGISE